MTADSVSARAAGRGSIVTAAPARRRACRRTARSAAAGGGASAAGASAPCLEHLGTTVRSALRVGTPAALQGEGTFHATSS